MGILSKIIKHTVSLPINVLKDVVTLGGVIDGDEPETKKQFEEFKKDMNDE